MRSKAPNLLGLSGFSIAYRAPIARDSGSMHRRISLNSLIFVRAAAASRHGHAEDDARQQNHRPTQLSNPAGPIAARPRHRRNALFSMVFSILASLAVLGATTTLAPAQTPTKLKLVLNWKYQGPQGMFFLAQDLGYFKAENLDVTIDLGNGSGAAVPLVANGTYDVGFGDINALIELAAKKPDDAPSAVYVMFNQPPFTIAVKAGSPIKTPQDLVGKTLGGPANDGALKLFPAFCKTTKIDCSTVKGTSVLPNLRGHSLLHGPVDGAFGHVKTIRFAALRIGV